MKPSQSVGVLYRNYPDYAQYPPGVQDIRPNDYENQPRYPQASEGRVSQEVQMRPSYNFIDPRQNLPGQMRPPDQHAGQGYHQAGMPPQRTSDRSSLSSRTSSNSNRDVRPHSAYYDPHNTNKNNHDSSRPRSEDVGSKLKEWQDKYEDPRTGYKQINGGNSPPYSNVGAHSKEPLSQPTDNPASKPTAHERLFSQSRIPQKPNNIGYNRQHNLYENTSPLQNEPPPPGHQQQRHSGESDLKPKMATRSTVVPLRSEPYIQNTDMPSARVDGQQNQRYQPDTRPSPTTQAPRPSNPDMMHQRGYQAGAPQHDQRNMSQQQRNMSQPDVRNDPRFTQDLRYAPDPRNQDYRGMQQGLQNTQDPRNVQQSNARTNYPQRQDQQSSVHAQPNSGYMEVRPAQQNSHFQQQNFADLNNHYGYPPDAYDLPPPPVDNSMPHNLAGPSVDSYQEELPPLPPPPPQEALIEQKLALEQQKLMQHINATNQFLASNPR